MRRHWKYILVAPALAALAFAVAATAISRDDEQPVTKIDRSIDRQAQQTLAEGRRIFRFDTFGDEAFWGDTLKLHQAIAGTRFGGVGPGVSPRTALAVGLKVDVDALPGQVVSDLKHGRINLDDPAVTLALLRNNAVVGLTGFFGASNNLHWGPGKFDAELILDGKAFRPDGKSAATLIPPDFQANRSPDKRYRTAPLKGLWTHQKGGFYHDGRFSGLGEVVNHYNAHFGLSLSEQEKGDLIEYLKSL
jgi:hypothetical protein